MSRRHPVVAITGSSGAGTTTVTRTFEHIFRREGINAAVVEGDSFHRYDRIEMKAKMAEAAAAGNQHFSHFGPEANLLDELEALFRSYGESGTGRLRKYLHNAQEAAPYGQPPGTFTPWEDVPAGTDLLFYEGLHGAVVTERLNVAALADLRSASCRSSTSNGSRSCTATRTCAAIRRKPSSTPSCAGCPIT